VTVIQPVIAIIIRRISVVFMLCSMSYEN